jgi:hypothetical protein
MKSSLFYLLVFCTITAWAVTLQAQTSTITVRIRSAVDVSPIQDAEISYFNPSGIKLSAGNTNSEGYLRFQVPFAPGDQVVIVANKFGEFTTQTISYTIKNPNLGPNECNFFLRVFTGLKVRGHVYNGGEGGNKPIVGVEISVPNPTGGEDRYFTDPQGLYEFNTIFESGQKLPFRLKAEGYNLLNTEKTLQVEGPGNNVFDFRLQPEPTLDWPKYLLYGSGGAAVISIGTYLWADSAYESYQDFGNSERENDYRRANRLNRTSIVSGIAAISMFTVSRLLKRKDKKAPVVNVGGFYGSVSPAGGATSPVSVTQVGLAYTF